MSNLPLLERWLPPTRRQGLPVMAGALPGLGHALSVHRDAVGAMRRARDTLGPVYWMNLGFGSWFLMCTGMSAFELLRHPNVVNARSRSPVAYIFGRSLLAADGPEHRRVRTAMNPTFSPRGLAEGGSGARIAEVVTARAERWAGLPRVEVHDEMKEMALDVIFRITGIGSQDLPAWRTHYAELLLGLLPIPWDLPGLPRRRALRATGWINAEIAALVAQARQDPQGDTLTHALTRARDEAGEPLSTDELVDNIRVLFLAGHETTASTTSWTILNLAQQPEIWDRLVAEAQAGAGVPTTLAEAKAFPFCEAVFRESVRLYGPAWFVDRRTTADLTYDGARIPAETNVAFPLCLWARDPGLYPDPDAFVPERWVGRSSIPPVELSPFGGGAHFCLGYHLAWLEMVAFLVALGRTLGATGQRPRLVGRPPVARFLPMPHPSGETSIQLQRS